MLSAFIFTTTGWATDTLRGPEFPEELVHFQAVTKEAIFAGTGKDTWDQKIRERSFMQRQGKTWCMWHDGYNDRRTPTHFLGYATSKDGWQWQRSSEKPVYDQGWIEDIYVVKHARAYYMFSEGHDDIAHFSGLGPSDQIQGPLLRLLSRFGASEVEGMEHEPGCIHRPCALEDESR